MFLLIAGVVAATVNHSQNSRGDRLQMETQESVRPVSAEKYEQESQEDTLPGNINNCPLRIRSISVPSFWDGVPSDIRRSGAYDVIGKAEAPPMSEIITGEMTSMMQGYIAAVLGEESSGDVLIAKGSERCSGEACGAYSCRIKSLADSFAIVCDEVPSDPEYADVLPADVVATRCTVDACGNEYPAFCLYRDYIRVFHSNVLLSGSGCSSGKDQPYCDFDKFREAVYCEGGTCETAGFTQHDAYSLMSGSD